MTRAEVCVIVIFWLAVAAVVWLWPLYVLYALIGLACIAALCVVVYFVGMAMAGGWGM